MTHQPYGPRAYMERLEAALGESVGAARHQVPALAQRLSDAGIDQRQRIGIDELSAVPVMSKDQLIDLQGDNPPFGGLVTSLTGIRRVFQSPGPLYIADFGGPDPGRWGPALERAGFAAGDRVLNTFSYHLSPAGALFDDAARSLGCLVVPGGVGNQETQLRAMLDIGVNAYIGLPSYLKTLLERKSVGVGPMAPVRLDRALVTGEPVTRELLASLSTSVDDVRATYGTSEAGHLGTQCHMRDGYHVADDALIEVLNPADGAPVPTGEEGEVVVTLLRARSPIVRLGSGDLSRWLEGRCACGDTTPRIAGVLGRVGDAVKVRGLFVHPRQVHAAMEHCDDVLRYRVLIERVGERDSLRCEIMPRSDGSDGLRASVAAVLRERLRLSVIVEIRPEIPASENAVINDLRVW